MTVSKTNASLATYTSHTDSRPTWGEKKVKVYDDNFWLKGEGVESFFCGGV